MPSKKATEADALWTRGDAAQMVRVDPKTVSRWADEGRLDHPLRIPGGHRGYRADDVRSLLFGEIPQQTN